MNAVKVRFKKLNAGAKMPDYGTEYAAGADLYACMEEPLTIKAGTQAKIYSFLLLCQTIR